MKSPSDLAEAAGSRPQGAVGPDSTRPRAALSALHAGAVIAVALALGFGAWLVLRGGDGTPEPPVSAAVTPQALRTLPDRTGHPVYWVGPRAGHRYELTRPTDGSVYIRYLPAGVRVGSERPDYLTIGSYPRPRALRLLRQLARRPDSASFPVTGGGLAVYGRDQPNSVYLAFPGGDVQIEVYDPSAPRARRLARSGQVRPTR